MILYDVAMWNCTETEKHTTNNNNSRFIISKDDDKNGILSSETHDHKSSQTHQIFLIGHVNKTIFRHSTRRRRLKHVTLLSVRSLSSNRNHPPFLILDVLFRKYSLSFFFFFLDSIWIFGIVIVTPLLE